MASPDSLGAEMTDLRDWRIPEHGDPERTADWRFRRVLCRGIEINIAEADVSGQMEPESDGASHVAEASR